MKKNIRAFTLIELLIIIALVGVITAYGLPGLRAFRVNSGLTTNTNDLVTALQFARSASIRVQDRVVICTSNNSQDPAPNCGGSTVPWQDGWIVFHDKNNNALLDGDDELLRVQSAVSMPGITIEPESPPGNIGNYVSFAPPAGEPMLVSGQNQSGLIKICTSEDATRVRGVELHFSGRISSTRENIDPCI